MNYPRKRFASIITAIVVTTSFLAVIPAAGATTEPGALGSFTASATAGRVTAVDIEYTPNGAGYWILDDTGEVHAFGAAPNHGWGAPPAGGVEYVAMAPTPSGGGYWLFASSGEVTILGDARDFGDLSLVQLDGPVVDAIATSSGHGYYMVSADGGIFAFGDAGFHGSIPQILRAGTTLTRPVIGIAPTSTGGGYWLIAADGGVFAFGDAPFVGSLPGVLGPGRLPDRPVVGLIPDGAGYLMLGGDGGIFSFGQSRFLGSLGGRGFDDVVAVAVRSAGDGYLIMRRSGDIYPFGASTDQGTILDSGSSLGADCNRRIVEADPTGATALDLLNQMMVELSGCARTSLTLSGDCSTNPPGHGQLCAAQILASSTTDVYLMVSSSREVSCHVWGLQHYSDRWIVRSAGTPEQLLSPASTPPTCK